MTRAARLRWKPGNAICADEAKFGLSEINWGILPGGGATKVVVDLLSLRDAMYYTLTGEMMDGQTAAKYRLVNESVPRAKLEARVTELATTLLAKNWVTLKAAKDAVRRVKEMTYDNAEDFLVRAQEAANFHDQTEGRKEGIRQFIDEKSFKPGLGAYDKGRKRRPGTRREPSLALRTSRLARCLTEVFSGGDLKQPSW
jgi:trans-feruloyl-CoA hydratase/vanillin synthase